MLAVQCTDIKNLSYPQLCTPKLDGIRCLIVNDGNGSAKAVTRKDKPIPNRFVREWLEKHCPIGFDGELVLADQTKATFQAVSSAIMSEDGEPDFCYDVFDYVCDVYSLLKPYHQRCRELSTRELRSFAGGTNGWCQRVKLILPEEVDDEEQLLAYESWCLQEKFEGVMLRTPDGPYKCGRSTEKQGWLLKLKRFTDGEAYIIGVDEKMHNANEATTDAFGKVKRSSHKANQERLNTLGALVVMDVETGVKFSIGTGFDEATRKQLWDQWHAGTLEHKIVKYKSQPTGVKDKPRFPVFLGLRDERDM